MRACVLAIAMVFGGVGQATAGDPVIPLERYQLPNGLEVMLSPDPRVPVVTVSVWYHVGSANETPGKSGFAHLFEHLMFQGSKHVGEDQHFRILQTIGSATNNGTTNLDRTNYYETVPAHQIETALWLESDRMGYLLARDLTKTLAQQIEVVRNERRERYDNAAYGLVYAAQLGALFPAGHPYAIPTIGKHEDIAKASLDDVKRFFKTWYVPANATLAIVGDFDPAVMRGLVVKWFGGFPKSVKPPRATAVMPVMASREVALEEPIGKQRLLVFAWHTPAYYAAGDAELDIAAAALARDGVGRLSKALVYDRPLATTVTATQASSALSSQFTIRVMVRNDAAIAEVKPIVLAELAKLAKSPVTADELQTVIAANEIGVMRSLQTTLGRVELLQGYNHFLGDPAKLTWDLDRYRTATAEGVRGVVAKWLVPERMLTLVVSPKGVKP